MPSVSRDFAPKRLTEIRALFQELVELDPAARGERLVALVRRALDA